MDPVPPTHPPQRNRANYVHRARQVDVPPSLNKKFITSVNNDFLEHVAQQKPTDVLAFMFSYSRKKLAERQFWIQVENREAALEDLPPLPMANRETIFQNIIDGIGYKQMGIENSEKLNKANSKRVVKSVVILLSSQYKINCTFIVEEFDGLFAMLCDGNGYIHLPNMCKFFCKYYEKMEGSQQTVKLPEAAAESNRVAQIQVQQKLIKGDANTFTVTFDSENLTNEKQHGWDAKSPLPKALKKRLQTMNQQHNSKMDQPTKQAIAATNRLQFQYAIAAKAAYEKEKSRNATSRRLVAKGDENTLFSVSAVNEENQASAGWGQQNTLIPPHLQDRLTEMNAKHATQPHAVRQQAANQRRTEQLRNVTNKAAMDTDQIVSNALSRKKLEIGDANTFTVTLGQDDDPTTDAQGWKQTKPRLPTQLAVRLHSLGATFQMKPYTARVEIASAKRAAHLSALVSKAGLENDKLAAAESRRKLASGDDSHFTVGSTKDEDAVVHQQGWGYKPPMPDRLQQRLQTLNQQHNSKMDQPSKQANAAANRLQFQQAIVVKAAYESEKGRNARSKKAAIVGNATDIDSTNAKVKN